MDIDHFKQFNDIYGHNIGDQVLVMVAKTISNTLRTMDTVCRWGGEEFIVVVPNVDASMLGTIAERIRFFIAKSWITVEKEHLNVTVSIGGTLAGTEDTMASIIQRADAHMYQSKASGRNRVTLS